MVTTALLALLCATPEVKVGSMGFRAVSVDEKKVEFFSDYFAQKVGEAGRFTVTTPSQISALIGLERQKQLLGCSDASSSCLAEMAGALGVQAVISGSVARIGSRYAVTVKVTSTEDAREIASTSQTLDREDDVLEWLSDQAEQIGPTIRRRFAPSSSNAPVTEVSGESGASLRSKAWIPGVVGGVALAGAGLLFVMAKGTENEMLRAARAEDAEAIAPRGRSQVVGMQVASGVAAAALATTLVFALWPESPSSVAVVPTQQGAVASFGGSF